MAIRYSIDADFGITFVRWSGLVTASDFLAHTARLYADAAWPPQKHLHLTDLREARLDRSVTEHLLVKIAESTDGIPASSTLKSQWWPPIFSYMPWSFSEL